MKKTFCFLLLMVGLYSCIDPQKPIYEYIISNKSTHNVELNYFYVHVSDSINYVDTILFSHGSEHTKYISFFINADSVYLNFDNAKQLIYRKGDGASKNILDDDNFIGGQVSDYLYQYIYEITDEDYDNAIEIK